MAFQVVVAAAAKAAAARFAKPALMAGAAWVLNKVGEKIADDGYESVKERTAKASVEKHQETLAQDLARARGWKYQRFVVDGAPRYIVWDEDRRAIAAFPQISDVRTPEALAERPELKGYVPNDDDLIEPPPLAA
ncbi:MAG: hypothetical protein M3Z95_00995 [Actinomycetota bacterium]|nr:hypothetical protein [Actinomycetota bacterium]